MQYIEVTTVTKYSLQIFRRRIGEMAHLCCLAIEGEFGYHPLPSAENLCAVSKRSLIGEIMGIDWATLRTSDITIRNTEVEHVVVPTREIYLRIRVYLAELYGIDQIIAIQLFTKTAKIATLLRMFSRTKTK